MKNEANGLTTRARFGHISCIDDHLFDVRPGIDVDEATSKAACLAESIATVAADGVGNAHGMDASTSYLVMFAAEAIQGLMNSVDGAYAGEKVRS